MPIYKDDGNVIAPLFDQIRRITETEGEMTFAGATEKLLNVTPDSGSGSMFVSTAVGILPTIYKGTATSAFAIDFTSSATGTLQE